jgi:hypothetical protein
MEWIASHSDVLNVILNAGMLLVWVVYAQLFFLSWRRGKLPVLLISATTTRDLQGECLVCNMAEQSCFIEAVGVCLRSDGSDEQTIFLNDIRGRLKEGEETGRLDEWTLQGPLEPGQMVSLGSFRELTVRTRNRTSEGFPGVDEFEVRIIAYYGAQRRPFGAVRTFRIRGDDGESFAPGQHFTRHLYSGSDAEQVTGWLKEFYGES